jgi:hypothetical protein
MSAAPSLLEYERPNTYHASIETRSLIFQALLDNRRLDELGHLIHEHLLAFHLGLRFAPNILVTLQPSR